MDIREGEIIMMGENGNFPQEFPEKKDKSIKKDVSSQSLQKNPKKKKEKQSESEKPKREEKKAHLAKREKTFSTLPEQKPEKRAQELTRQLKNKNLKEKEEIFLEEFSPFIEAISKTYGIPKNLFLSLIERESSFDPHIDDNPRSFGFNQLTGVAFDDMKYEYKIQERSKKTKKLETKIIGQGGRGYLYVDLFLKMVNKNPDLLDQSLIEKIPNENTRKRLKKIGEYAKKGVNTTKDKDLYDKMIRELYRLAHTDDYVNILIGAISYGGLRKEGRGVKSGDTKDVFGINTTIAHDLRKIKDSTLVKFVMQ